MAETKKFDVKKEAKATIMEMLVAAIEQNGLVVEDGANLDMKGTALVVRDVELNGESTDLKITITAPAANKGNKY